VAATPSSRVRPPSPTLLVLEPLAWMEYAAFIGTRRLLRLAPGGDGHPVLVLPGFTGSDRSTEPLRRALRSKGYWVHGWRLGTNVGPRRRIVRGIERRLVSLHERHGTTVSLVGVSLGGVYARELARHHPSAVRQVITLGSPFRLRPGDRSHGSLLYDALTPPDEPFLGAREPEHLRPPLEVPTTAIYTRTDGIVRWHAAIETVGDRRENVEVVGTHNGLGFNLAAAWAVVDRLAQPEGTWVPFRRPLALAHLYPRPVTWDPVRQRVANSWP
jgi:pimeloyl-ACP methyl ester carboxylesterase